MTRIDLPVRQRGVCCDLPAVPDETWSERQASLLKALADPTRLSMLAALHRATAPVCICDFTAAYDLSQPTISHRMAKLREAGLVESSRRGIWVYYQLRSDMTEPVRRLMQAVLATG